MCVSKRKHIASTMSIGHNASPFLLCVVHLQMSDSALALNMKKGKGGWKMRSCFEHVSTSQGSFMITLSATQISHSLHVELVFECLT